MMNDRHTQSPGNVPSERMASIEKRWKIHITIDSACRSVIVLIVCCRGNESKRTADTCNTHGAASGITISRNLERTDKRAIKLMASTTLN